MKFMAAKQYGNRAITDAQQTEVFSPCRYHGVMDRHARFLEENQLLDEEAWLLFVQQFRDHPDDADNGWRGEYFGKMMRGACMTYQYTQSGKLYALLTRTAEDMLTAQDSLGRFSSYSVPKEFYGWDLWGRKYVMLGFLHYLEICKDPSLTQRITAALIRHLDYIIREIYHKKVDLSTTAKHWNGINSASILEPVVRMYNLTGTQSYLDFAEYIVEFLCTEKTQIFALALENTLAPHQYPETKAYEIMSCFEGLLEYYRATGIEKWKTAVINFVDAVARNELSIIGCAGCLHEMFDHAAVTQTDPDYTGVMQETCVTVTWMKLCNQLLMLTGDARYADLIERSAYNALYGAINTEKAENKDHFLVDSYSPLRFGIRGKKSGGYKKISDSRYYGCCVAICAAGTALPLLTAATHGHRGITFNYYESGTVTVGGTEFSVSTKYPAEGTVYITALKTDGREFSLNLRNPGFSGAATKVSLNDILLPCPEEHNGYLSLSKAWEPGDRIELQFAMPERVLKPLGIEGKPESRNYLAVTYGPLVLARDARLGEAGSVLQAAASVSLAPCSPPEFAHVFCGEADLGGQKIKMVDYSSAGKTWSKESQTEVWIKTHE